MIRDISTKDSGAILTKMCKMINVDPDTVRFEERDWFTQHTWTKEQENAFIDWLAQFLIDNKYVRPQRARHEAEKLNAMYGWKTEG